MNPQEQVTGQVTKVVTAWGLIGITSWADLSYFLAAAYSAILICEWLWKKVAKPFAVARGWMADRNGE